MDNGSKPGFFRSAQGKESDKIRSGLINQDHGEPRLLLNNDAGHKNSPISNLKSQMSEADGGKVPVQVLTDLRGRVATFRFFPCGAILTSKRTTVLLPHHVELRGIHGCFPAIF